MGKTPLCTDAAEPVAGGAVADKYVSRQHHGVAHRAEPSREPRPAGRYRGMATPKSHGIPRRVPHRTSQFLFATSCSLPFSFPLVLSLLALSIHFFLSVLSLCPRSFALSSFLPFCLFPPCLFLSLFLLPSVCLCPPRIDESLFFGGRCLYLFHSPTASVPRFYTFEYYGNVDALVDAELYCRCFCHPTGSPARSRGEEGAPRRTVRDPNGVRTGSRRRWPSFLSALPCHPFRRIYIVGGMRLLSAAASIISPNEDAHRHPRVYPEARYYMPLSRSPCHFRSSGSPPCRRAAF